MKTWLTFCLGTLLATTAVHSVALNPVPPLTPLYSAKGITVSDNFYTVDPSQLAEAINLHGFVDTGVVGYLEKKAQPNTAAFRRFYKGHPETSHFYTTSASEESGVLAAGWVFERIEGYLYTKQVPGSIALYRVSRYTIAIGDLIRKYTTSQAEVNTLVSQGWQLDGIAGYLYSQATPTVAGGKILGVRCPGSGPCTHTGNFRDYYFPILAQPSTSRPVGYTQQRMRFRFSSPDFFGGGAGHLSFAAHGKLNLYTPAVDLLCPQGAPQSNCTWHRAAGFILVSDGCTICGGNPQIASELFWVTGNNTSGPDFWNGAKLQNNRDYIADLLVANDGLMTVEIKEAATGIVVAALERDTAPTFPASSPFPAELTGYFMASAADSFRDFTFYVTNLQVTWLP